MVPLPMLTHRDDKLRENPIVFGFAEWSSSLPPFSFTQKKKRYPVGYPFFLAQKERLELSRRFPDLRP